MQRGCRGIFVGFPKDQAGWLIYVPEKIAGSYLVVSMDVAFDQYFVSGIYATKTEFDGGQIVRNVGKSGGNRGAITESTGDFTNLGPSYISHWEKDNTFDSAHSPASFIDSNLNDDDSTEDSESYDGDESDDVPAKAIDGPIDLNMGTTNMDGLRRSVLASKK